METVNCLGTAAVQGGWTAEDFKFCPGVGTGDPFWSQTVSQIQEIQKRKLFAALRGTVDDGAAHDLAACTQYFYYALRECFA